jgi:hypothetical protein
VLALDTKMLDITQKKILGWLCCCCELWFSHHFTEQASSALTRLAFSREVLTNLMEQYPSWETDSYSAGQEIPWLLFNEKVPYRVHKSTSLDPNLCQMNAVQSQKTTFKIYFNIILPSLPRSMN